MNCRVFDSLAPARFTLRAACPCRSGPAGSVLRNANSNELASDTDALQSSSSHHQRLTLLSDGRTENHRGSDPWSRWKFTVASVAPVVHLLRQENDQHETVE